MAKVSRQAVFDGEKSPMQILAEDTVIAEKNVLVYTEVVKRLNTELTNTSNLAKAMQTAMASSTGSPLGDLEKSNALHKEAIGLVDKHRIAKVTLQKAEQQLEAETVKLITLEERYNQELLKTEKLEGQLAAQKARAAAQQERMNQKLAASNSAYARVQSWLTKLNKEHRDLAIRQELGVKLTAEEAKRMEVLAGRIGKYDAALKAVDASQGKHFRNVGNYKSGFDGLSNSVNQLTRELPAFANSVQTGFMAISNNLPIFFDEIKRIRQANQQLAAEGQKVTSVFKQLMGSIFSFGTILSLAVTALTFFGPKIAEWISGSEKSEKQLKKEAKAQEELNRKRREGAEFVGQEAAALVGHLIALKNTNAGTEERIELINKVNDQYKTTLKNLKDEKAFQEQVNNAIFKYIAYQREAYKVKRNTELIEQNLAKQEDLYKKIRTQLGLTNEEIDKIGRKKGSFQFLANELAQGITPIQSISSQLGITEKRAQKLVEAYNKLRDADKEAFSSNRTKEDQQAKNDYLFGAVGGVKELLGYTEDLTLAEETQSKQILGTLSTLDAANYRLEQYGINIGNAEAKMEDLDITTDATTKQTKKLTTSLQEFDDALERRLDLQERERNLRQAMTEINQDNQIETVADIAQKQIDEMLKSAEETGQIYVDTIEKLLNEEYDLRKAAAIERAQFEKDELIKGMDATRVLEYERLTKERDELLKQEGLTAQDRADIRASYNDRLRELNGRMLDEERIVALEREKIELELQQKLGTLDKERVDRLNEVNDLLIDAQQEYADKTNKKAQDEKKKLEELEKKHQKEMADLRKKGVDFALDQLARQSKAREDEYRKEADASKDLENQLIAQANAGIDSAADSLAVQKQVTAEKLRLAEMEQRRQEAIKQIQVGYQILEQLIAKGDSAPVAAVKTVGLLDFIKGLFLKAKGFFGGTKRTVGEELGDPLFSGRDGHVIRVDGSEKILNPALSKKTGNATTDQIVDGFLKYDSMRVNNMIMLDSMQRSPQRTDETHSPILLAQLKRLDAIVGKFDEMPKEYFTKEVVNAILKTVHVYEKGNDREITYVNV